MNMSTLEIRDLHVRVETENGPKEILKGVNLTVRSGETHAIMGHNGSGKSTLAYTIAGHPKYEVTQGSIKLDGENVLDMTVDERARAGLFLAMQYPVDVPGVSVSNFLRTAVTAVRGEAPKLREWIKEMRGAMTDLQIDQAFAERSVNEGFSGGERKRHEILQMELLKPKMAVLDETDSGLDVDALKVVSDGVNRVRETGSTGVLRSSGCVLADDRPERDSTLRSLRHSPRHFPGVETSPASQSARSRSGASAKLLRCY